MIKVILPLLFSSFLHHDAYAGFQDIITALTTGSPTYSTNIHSKSSQLSRKAPDLDAKALNIALQAYHCASKKGYIKKPYLTIIDYSKPSNMPRLWTFDLSNDTLLFRSYVAHGKNSGHLKAKSFSDRLHSKQSSLGLFVTGARYIGSKGESMRLHGMDKGFNGQAKPRAIVMHGAAYVSQTFLKRYGRLGLSWGCPAVSHELAKPLIKKIKDGTALFSYYPHKEYFKHAKSLKC